MCGINGFTANNPKLIRELNQELTHRGPDYTATYLDQDVSLGHTLLSIRGTIGNSKQPVTRADSEWILLFNGQIYNTRQIIERQLPWLSNHDVPDTTVLYELILRLGWGFISHIQGMYAIAIYNKKERTIRLYRDPAGQKPIYYAVKAGTLYFSSELKTFKRIPGLIGSRASPLGVSIATYLGYIPGRLTLFENVFKVEPSQCVIFDLGRRTIDLHLFDSTDNNYYQGVSDVFQKLVEEHLLSNHEVILNLSGGLDSSLLLHEMRRLNKQVSTYTTIFDVDSALYNDDALIARKLAKHYQTNHTEVLVTKQAYLDIFEQSMRDIEEPNYNISLPLASIIAKREGSHGDRKRVVLSGDGGDELFGGYDEYRRIDQCRKLQTLLTPWLFNYLKNTLGKHAHAYDYRDITQLWLSFRRFYLSFAHDEQTDEIVQYMTNIKNDYFKTYQRKRGAIYESMLCGRVFWLAGENFIRSDKLFMRESLEVRAPLAYQPFRDHFDPKLGTYMDGKINKKYLRDYYCGKLPDYVIQKGKTGWKSPLPLWYDAAMKHHFLTILKTTEHYDYLIDWNAVRSNIESRDTWPGKVIHLYLSLATLAQEYGVEI